MSFKSALLTALRKVGILLLLWFVALQIFDQWLLNSTHQAMMAEHGVQGKVWMFAGLSIVSSVLAPMVATLIVFAGWQRSDTNILSYFSKHLGDLVREQLRAFGSVLMWSFLLIIPGLVRFFEMSLLPWVVCFDAEYGQGRRDALKESRRVFYKVWPRLSLLLLVFWMILPLGMTMLDAFRSYSDSPVTAFGLSLVDVFLFLLFQYLLYKLWEKAHGADIQVAGH